MTRVPGAVQLEALHRRTGTHLDHGAHPDCVGPGSAAHHSASLRAAPRPGHEAYFAGRPAVSPSARRLIMAAAKIATATTATRMVQIALISGFTPSRTSE